RLEPRRVPRGVRRAGGRRAVPGTGSTGAHLVSERWTGAECAAAWSVKPATWLGYVSRGQAPQPLSGPDAQGRRQWGAEGGSRCGVSLGWTRRPERAGRDAMTATRACRGPDDEGTWLSEHAALGHRRLAIIDLPGGRQPMSLSTPDGPLVLVYSGETYNF